MHVACAPHTHLSGRPSSRQLTVSCPYRRLGNKYKHSCSCSVACAPHTHIFLAGLHQDRGLARNDLTTPPPPPPRSSLGLTLMAHARGSGARRMKRGAVRDTDTSQPRHKQCTGCARQDLVFHCNAVPFKVLLLKEREAGGWGKTGFSKTEADHGSPQYHTIQTNCTGTVEKLMPHNLYWKTSTYLLTYSWETQFESLFSFFSFPKNTKRISPNRSGQVPPNIVYTDRSGQVLTKHSLHSRNDLTTHPPPPPPSSLGLTLMANCFLRQLMTLPSSSSSLPSFTMTSAQNLGMSCWHPFCSSGFRR